MFVYLKREIIKLVFCKNLKGNPGQLCKNNLNKQRELWYFMRASVGQTSEKAEFE